LLRGSDDGCILSDQRIAGTKNMTMDNAIFVDGTDADEPFI
jgi:hypothetical protein